jgi:hypothetical protein
MRLLPRRGCVGWSVCILGSAGRVVVMRGLGGEVEVVGGARWGGPTYLTYGTLAWKQAPSLVRNWRAAAHIRVINTATDCGTAVQFNTVATPSTQETRQTEVDSGADPEPASPPPQISAPLVGSTQYMYRDFRYRFTEHKPRSCIYVSIYILCTLTNPNCNITMFYYEESKNRLEHLTFFYFDAWWHVHGLLIIQAPPFFSRSLGCVCYYISQILSMFWLFLFPWRVSLVPIHGMNWSTQNALLGLVINVRLSVSILLWSQDWPCVKTLLSPLCNLSPLSSCFSWQWPAWPHKTKLYVRSN